MRFSRPGIPIHRDWGRGPGGEGGTFVSLVVHGTNAHFGMRAIHEPFYCSRYNFKFASVTAPSEAEVTALAYLASTPRV